MPSNNYVPRCLQLPIAHYSNEMMLFLIIVICSGIMLFTTSTISAAQSPPEEQSASGVETTAEDLVSIDLTNVDINVFIKFISDLTKKNFVVDDKVRGKVTIISPGKITVGEAYRVFESVLEVYGFSAVPSKDIIKIVPSPDARTKSIKTRLEEEAGDAGDSVITQIIPLRYADPEEIKRLFTPLISRNSVILSYGPTNTLIITDVYSNIKRLLNILKAIDITGVGQQIATIPVEYADASKLVTILKSIFTTTAKGKNDASKNITFVADERTNVIIVLAGEGDVDNIRNLVKILDKKTPRAQSRIHVYYLKNASAEDLAKVLMDIPQKTETKSTEGKPTAPVVSDKVRITADKATNSLIIMADMEDYVTLEDIIKKIDIPRSMVYIEALIMEVSLEKDFRLGTEWLIGQQGSYQGNDLLLGGGFSGGATGGDAGYSTIGSTVNPLTGSSVTLLPPGFSFGLFGEAIDIAGIQFPSIGAIIQAYKKDQDVHILSTPQILTTDNQEAKIYVGQNVPFQTTASASTTGTELYNSYEYRDVGKTLTITPQISQDRMVRLQLALEMTDLQSATDNRPTTLKRTVETTVLAKDGQTVVLGGLIDDKTGLTTYRVPCLGEIPIIGTIFRSKARNKSRSNLYIFLTPRVLQDPKETQTISDTKRDEIEKLQEDFIKLYDKKHKPEPEAATIDNKKLTDEKQAPASKSSNEIEKNDGPTSLEPLHNEDPAQPSPTGVHSSSGADSPTVSKEINAQLNGQGSGVENNVVDKALPPDSESVNGYTVEVAVMQKAKSADDMVLDLTARGFPAYAVRTQVEGKTWYQLRIGFYKTRNEASKVMEELRGLQYAPTLIELR